METSVIASTIKIKLKIKIKSREEKVLNQLSENLPSHLIAQIWSCPFLSHWRRYSLIFLDFSSLNLGTKKM